MKKLFLFSFLFLTGIAYAQTEHMEFKGIPITGDLEDFAQTLVSQGFTIDTKLDDAIILNGEFVSKDCEVYILSTPMSNTVWKVAVYLPKSTSWSSIKLEYNNLKNQLITKYGKPKYDYAFFSEPYYEGDGYEMQALRLEKCSYAAFWETNRGAIAVRMSKSQEIIIIYEDAVNSQLMTKEKSNKIQNDI